MPGVIRTRVGYTGGTRAGPTYHALGDHTESIQIDFAPSVITYRELLDIFWQQHNPWARAYSRQYMAAIFAHGDEQRRIAEASRRAVAVTRPNDDVRTPILPAGPFYLAEDYHQKYYLRGHRDITRELEHLYATPAAFLDSMLVTRLNAYVTGLIDIEDLQAERTRYRLSDEQFTRILNTLDG